MTVLLVTVRFLDDRYHGLLARGGPPEWPPSPFRLFCALVAGVARRGELDAAPGRALSWLQSLQPPVIVAPKSRTGRVITRFVPNNDGDEKPDRQERLTGKPTIPTLMRFGADAKPEVHYLWDIHDQPEVPFAGLCEAARSLTTLGWGIDMAFADARLIDHAKAESLGGVRWLPKPGVWRNAGMLRVPAVDCEHGECTLSNLRHCHQTAVNRIEHGQPLHSVEEPRVFDRVFYASSERPISRPYRLFELRTSDGERYRHPPSRLMHLAGMVRHLAIEQMKRFPSSLVADGFDDHDDWVQRYIAGHARNDGTPHRQLSYLPLPSIGHEHTDPGVRRVMIAGPVGDDVLLAYVARRLAGQTLRPRQGNEFDGREPPMLVPIPCSGDGVTRCYTEPSDEWHSFTPVVLPGHDDHKMGKRRALIERTLAQSGVDHPCEFEWSPISRFPKAYSAYKYDRAKRPVGFLRPAHLLSQTAVHLTIRFNDGLLVPGPLAIGAGRHCGLGLFAVDSAA
ncbi:MAG: type I-U CRISPR-associated protein Cas5/Cas6 [Phycisphaeraceae bacterium]|nr:type I-U CRISPR-associated protein Cas5/Cas6 [Phycisphaeraceae bacterium]